jgi:BlaI family penicillinase repressor
MHAKGYVARDDDQRSHVYRPVLTEEKLQVSLVSDMLRSFFGGSPMLLVMKALHGRKLSREELASLRRIVEEQSDR